MRLNSSIGKNSRTALRDVGEDPVARLAEADRRGAPRAEVRRHDHDRAREARDLAGGVGQPALVEQLQQQVQRLRVRLLDLVEQHDAERLRADARGQQALGVPAIADQPRDRVGARQLAHVDAHEPRLIAVEVLGDRGRELGLAGAGRAGEQHHADRAARIGEPGADLQDHVGGGAGRGGLADHARGERGLDLGGDRAARRA